LHGAKAGAGRDVPDVEHAALLLSCYCEPLVGVVETAYLGVVGEGGGICPHQLLRIWFAQ